MRIKNVRYGRTVNRGNFESERFDVELELDADDTFEDALELCKGLSSAALEQLDERGADDLAKRMITTGVQ